MKRGTSLHRAGAAVAALVAWAALGPAEAQVRQRSRVLVVFDTSGSMGVDIETGEPTGGDNSREYPGGGGLSRLFVAKEALTELVTTQSEVEFALMRYPMREGPGINRGILDGRQNQSYDGIEERPLNYAGECDGVLRPAGDAAFSLIVPFAPDNEADIVRWMDHREDFPADKELRAEGLTPIVETLRLAEQYLLELGRADPGARCRRTAVVLLTDGSESCVPFDDRIDRLTEQAAALRTLRFEVDGEPVAQDVRTFVVAYGVNERAREQLTELARAGGTAVDLRGDPDPGGGPYEADDRVSLRRAFSAIVREAIPTELCNGEDDDCDGSVDEGVQNACGGCGPAPEEDCDGVDDDCDGRVDEGALNACGQCGPLPAETCNAIDDDCDGAVDEAVDNACGGCARVREEVCNGVDDDCDGRVDNRPGSDLPLSRPCSRDVGACAAGREACRAGEWGACDGVVPRDEACDGADDDCDGAVDEDVHPCGPAVDIGDVGECRVGVRRCDPAACAAPGACADDGWLAACEGGVGPADEACNGRDDDCDGDTDEGLINACGACGPPPPEACNGADDNCDGRIDDDARCPFGFLCFAGECVQPCAAAGECAPGFACVAVWPGARYCHPDPCAAAYCPPGRVCDPAAGACLDPCDGVECEGGARCALGECIADDCPDGCADTEACVDGACVGDPCADVACEGGAFCRGGACVEACRLASCGADRVCADGLCIDDPCGGRCLRGSRCDPVDGACVADPCAAVSCPRGTACVDGSCAADAACATVRCPPGTACVDGTCTDFTPGVDPRTVDAPDFGPPPDAGSPPDAGPVDATLDRGPEDAAPDTPPATPPPDGCRQGPAGDAPPWTAALLVFVALRRARRRR